MELNNNINNLRSTLSHNTTWTHVINEKVTVSSKKVIPIDTNKYTDYYIEVTLRNGINEQTIPFNICANSIIMWGDCSRFFFGGCNAMNGSINNIGVVLGFLKSGFFIENCYCNNSQFSGEIDVRIWARTCV